MKKVLLTGATGYLGSKLAAKLLQADYPLACPILSDVELGYLSPYIQQVEGIMIDSSMMDEKIMNFSPDIVIHMACRYDRDNIPLMDLTDANLIFPLKILSTILKMPHKVLWLNTNTALGCILNGYTLSKYQFAEWGRYYSLQGKIDFSNILLEHFFGEGDSSTKFFPYLLGAVR